MKRIIVPGLLLAIAGFLGGVVYTQWRQANVRTRAAKQRKVLYYVDPMHPAYKSDRPGIAPDCGMKLEPVYENGPSSPAGTANAVLPPGTIHISADKQQLIGVRFGEAEFTESGEALRAVGTVAADETRISHVHTRLDGWVEHVYADFNGAFVHKGDPLLTLYSPDMLAGEQEFLLSLKARDVMHSGAIPSAVESSESLVEASRRKLELWDLSGSQIDQIEKTGVPIHSVTIYSPAQGYITSRNSFPNQRITPETELYSIADLSRVWIIADVFEADLPKIHLGQMATIALPYKTANLGARIGFIQPEVDPQTRTVKLRLETGNSGSHLKPGMFVDVDFKLSSPRQLTVPADAVLDAGQTQTVFVDRGNGDLEPRPVTIGDYLGDRVVILQGLSPGERIVTSANFLVDSESRLKAALSGMSSAAGRQGAHAHD